MCAVFLYKDMGCAAGALGASAECWGLNPATKTIGDADLLGGACQVRRAEPRSVSAACRGPDSGVRSISDAGVTWSYYSALAFRCHAAETLRGSALQVLRGLEFFWPRPIIEATHKVMV